MIPLTVVLRPDASVATAAGFAIGTEVVNPTHAVRCVNGTANGRTTVFLAGKNAAGESVVMETTLALLRMAVNGMQAADEAEGRPQP